LLCIQAALTMMVDRRLFALAQRHITVLTGQVICD
jgi:hypothetical protein